MNCKPNDMAVVVGSCDLTGNHLIGRVFTLTTSYVLDGYSYWHYDGVKVQTPWGQLNALWDGALRPIRDEPGQDESLTWAGLPQEVMA